MNLEELIAVMVKHRATRVKLPDMEVELDASAFRPVITEGLLLPKPPLFSEDHGPSCPCGHSIAIDHNELGCLMGCPAQSCVSAPELPDPD